MKLWKVLCLGVVFSLSGCGDPAEDWIKDGFMYEITQKEWDQASGVQRIGTAGIWLKRLQANGLLSFDGVSVADLKPLAVELTQCINELSANGGAYNEKAAGQAIVCVNLLGWAKK